MKKIFPSLLKLFTLLSFVIAFSACVKDVVKQTFTYYEPVLKLKTEVLASVKSAAPTPLSNTGKIVLYGNYILVNELNKGIHIIDNSNPSAPVNKKFIAITGNEEISIKNNILYANIFSDLVALDISDLDNIVVKKMLPNVFISKSWSYDPQENSTYYAVDWIEKTTTDKEKFNFYNRNKISLDFAQTLASSSGTGINGSTSRMVIVNNFMYAVDRSMLTSINISTVAQPAVENTTAIGWEIETIYPVKDKLFIGGQTGMFIYDIAVPALPQFLGTFTHACFNDPVIADGNFAYVTLKARETQSPCWGAPAAQTNELDIVNISNLYNPVLAKIYNMKSPTGLWKDGNLLFICDGSAGLKIFNAADPLNLQLINQVTGIEPQDIIAGSGVAIVIAKNGLYQYDYSTPAQTRLISKILINK